MTGQQFGTEVLDKNGRRLGKIDYVVRDSWSGDVKKYIIYRQPPDKDVSFAPDDISETTESTVILKIEIE
ncbi:MAG: hypothetical protein JSU79_08875 [Dehalococcoidales bacterium]|nr:MAG: hypothetical protein JSU79_08875 [Dehalococcoidales bacterium]